MELVYKDWDKVNINTYRKLLDVSNNITDVIDSEIRIVSILCDCPEDDILNLPVPEYQHLRKQAQWIASKPEVKTYTCPKQININGQVYTVHSDISKITTAQYIDFQNYLKLNDLEKYLSYILAVFIIPKGKEYGDVPVEDVVNALDNNLSIKESLSMCFFFMTEYLSLMNLTGHYLEQRIKKMMKKEKNPEIQKKLKETLTGLKTNGVGLIA